MGGGTQKEGHDKVVSFFLKRINSFNDYSQISTQT